MRKISATESFDHIVDLAYCHPCPYCNAGAGEFCRARIGKGSVRSLPHSRRIDVACARRHALASELGVEPPAKSAENRSALCCECGNLRTVSSKFKFSFKDPNKSCDTFDHPQGWRVTGTLKCDTCGWRTRHALLREDDDHRDSLERRQRVILGAEEPGPHEDRERMRAEYFALFPRNPNLRHRFWMDDADKRREQGETHMPAVCGAIGEIPRSWSSKKPAEGELIEPAHIDWNTEYEDSETGEWWIDMECVDCLRVANTMRLEKARDLLLTELLEVSNTVAQLTAAQVSELREHIGRLMDNASTN